MATYENLEFLNLNALRSYPFRETGNRTDDSGLFVMPNDFIVDAGLAISSDFNARYFVSRIIIGEIYITIEVVNHLQEVVGTFNIEVSTFTSKSKYFLAPTSAFAGAVGYIVVESLISLDALPSGVLTFKSEINDFSLEFEARTVGIAAPGVNRLQFTTAEGQTISLTGDVNLVARSNLQFKYEESTNTVYLDAGDGLGLNKNCNEAGDCIRTINGVGPDENGNFILDGTDCAVFEVIPAGTGIVLQDSCCKPCMGCTDVETITNRSIALENSLLDLRDYIINLQKLYEQYKITISYTCECGE